MVPEFISRDGSEPMTGELGELTCLENQVAMLMCFHRLGYKNIIASDIDDLRTSDIPVVFKGTDFITLKLVCSDLKQILGQAIIIIETTPSCFDYEYTKPPKDRFYSWVFANGLR